MRDFEKEETITTLEELDKAARSMEDSPEPLVFYPISISQMAMSGVNMMRSIDRQNYIGTPSKNSSRHTKKDGFKRKKKGKSR